MPAKGLRANRDQITTRQIRQPATGPAPDSSTPTGQVPLNSLSGADDLKAIEALAGTGGLLAKTAANTWALRQIALQAALDAILSITNPAGVAGNPTLGLDNQNANTVLAGPASGSPGAPAFRALVAGDIPDLSETYQPRDGDLDAIAELSTTSFGRGLLTQGDATAARSTLGLGTMAVADADDYTPTSGLGSAAFEDADAFDAAGSASSALLSANSYTDSAISGLASVYQPLDADLTAIAALSTTSFGRSLLTRASSLQMLDLPTLGISNLVANPDFEAGDVEWLKTGNWAIVSDAPNAFKGSWYATKAAGTNVSLRTLKTYKARQGDKIYVAAALKRSAGFDGTGIEMGIVMLGTSGSDLAASSRTVTTAELSTSYQLFETIVEVTNANTVAIQIRFAPTGTHTAGTLYVGYVEARTAATEAMLDLEHVETAAPSGGSASPWKLGGYTTGAVSATGVVRVEVGGVAYDLLAATV